MDLLGPVQCKEHGRSGWVVQPYVFCTVQKALLLISFFIFPFVSTNTAMKQAVHIKYKK